MTSLVFILNLLSELEFFKNENVGINFTLFLSLLKIAGRQTRKTVFVNLSLVKVSFDWGQYLES